MAYGRWTLVDGKWVAKDQHSAPEPTSRGITEGLPPAGFVHGPTPAQRADRFRRFDRPSEAQVQQSIRRMEEEHEARKNRVVSDLVHGAARDLESGKVRISDEVLEKNLPFGSTVDERGIKHILPKYRLPEKPERAEVDAELVRAREEAAAAKRELATKNQEERERILHQTPGDWEKLRADAYKRGGL